jgi:hypothetical protein
MLPPSDAELAAQILQEFLLLLASSSHPGESLHVLVQFSGGDSEQGSWSL